MRFFVVAMSVLRSVSPVYFGPWRARCAVHRAARPWRGRQVSRPTYDASEYEGAFVEDKNVCIGRSN